MWAIFQTVKQELPETAWRISAKALAARTSRMFSRFLSGMEQPQVSKGLYHGTNKHGNGVEKSQEPAHNQQFLPL